MVASTIISSLLERVTLGRPAAQVVREEVERLGRKRIFVVANRSLGNSLELNGIVEALGTACVGVYGGVTAHTPRECVIEGAAMARAVEPDLLLAVGGGSVIDGTKIMLMCLRHDCTRPEQLSSLVHGAGNIKVLRPEDADRWLRMIAVPTTFSAAEFADAAGATEAVTLRKQAFVNPMMMPQTIILDPAMTLTAPLELLLATGVKAIDHAVERLTNPNSNPYSDAVSLSALRVLVSGLAKMKQDPADLAAREASQYGIMMAKRGALAGVDCGLSHAIAHQLGAFSAVPHGLTSCLLLPAVMHWLVDAIPDRQRLICDAMGSSEDDASIPLRALIKALGLPSRLRDAKVQREDLAVVAERTMTDPLARNSPRLLLSPSDVLEILEDAW